MSKDLSVCIIQRCIFNHILSTLRLSVYRDIFPTVILRCLVESPVKGLNPLLFVQGENNIPLIETSTSSMSRHRLNNEVVAIVVTFRKT
jgi:hypothetical protein